MGIITNVLNWEELVDKIEIAVPDVVIDTTNIEGLLNTYFPELIDKIKALLPNQPPLQGLQKMRGFASNGAPIIFTPDANIALTGVTFSQSGFDPDDKWSLRMTNGVASIALLNDIYVKDSLQHKYFERFHLVPAGYSVVIEIESYGSEKTFWFDLEYLEEY